MKHKKGLQRCLALLLAVVMSTSSTITALATVPGSETGDGGGSSISTTLPNDGSEESGSSSNKGDESDPEPDPEEPGGSSEPSGESNSSAPETPDPGEGEGDNSSSSGSSSSEPGEGGEEGNSSEPDPEENTEDLENESSSDISEEQEEDKLPPANDPYEVIIDQIYNVGTGELEPLSLSPFAIGSEDIGDFSQPLRTEWTNFYYPKDYFIVAAYPVYGQWGIYYLGDQVAYCLQPLNLVSTDGVVYEPIEFNGLSPQKQDMIARLMLYGGDGSNVEEHICTQVLIWEVVLGQISAVDLSPIGSRNLAYRMVSENGLDSTYEEIRSKVLKGFVLPSFMVRDKELLESDPFPYKVPDDGTALELVDENGVLSEFDVEDGGGYTFEKDGDTLRVTADDPAAAEDPYDPTVTSDLLEDAYAPSVLAVGNNKEQMKGILVLDPAGAFFRLSTTEGGAPTEESPKVEISFKKLDPEHFHPTDYDGPRVEFADGHDSDDAAFDDIAGAGIEITNQDTGETMTVITPDTVELGEGTWKAVEIMAPGGYYINDGWEATITITIPEPEKPEGGGEGGGGGEEQEPPEPEVEIEIDYGDYVGDYFDEPEVDTEGDIELVLPDNRQKGELTLDKIDFETDFTNHNDEHIAQGDATFEGAVFGLYAAEDIILPTTGVQIYAKDDLVATATTDANGSFTITDIEIGNYYLQELIPSTGYVFKNEELRGQIYHIGNPYQVAPGMDDKPGSVDPGDVNPPAVNTLKLDDKPAQNDDYTGTQNEYENTVIKGDLTIYKSLEDGDISNEDDEDSDVTEKPKAADIYFGVYLTSKAEAGGNDFYNIHDDSIGDGTEDSSGTQGYTLWELLNGNYYSPLPDEFFTRKPLDPNNPPPFHNPSVDDALGEVTDPSEIYQKDLYMVLKTNDDGYASTLDPSTIVWSVARAGSGDGHSNQMEDGGASLGFPTPDPSSPNGPVFNGIQKGGKVNNMQLPYGEYTVVEFNPPEGRDPIIFTVFIGRDPADPDAVEPKPAPGEDYPYEDGWNNFEYVFNFEDDTLRQSITIVKTDSESGLVIPQADAVYRIWSWDNETLNNVVGGAATEHPTRPYHRSAEDGGIDLLVPPTVILEASSLSIPVGQSIDKPAVLLDFDTPSNIKLADGRPQIEWTAEEKAQITKDFSKLTFDIEDTSIASLGFDGKITAHKAGTTQFTVILPFGMESFTGSITVTDGGTTAATQQKTFTCDGHWIQQRVNYPSGEIVLDFHTDETGSFMLNEPLVYGDYLLYEKQAPWSYQVSMEPYPFTVEKSSVHQPNIYLNLTIKQADDVQKGRIVVEKIGNLLTGAETYTTLLGMTAMRPVWELMPLGEGAEFELYAREDIITPDGVKHYSAGEYIETLTSDRSGVTSSSELYLGKYYLKESKTPHGYINDGKEYDIELTYKGQVVSVFPEYFTLENARQNVIFKILKQFKTTDGKYVPANDVYFGLYAGEDVYLSPAVSAGDIPNGNTGVDAPEDPPAATSLVVSLEKSSLILGDTGTMHIEVAPEGADDEVNVFGYDPETISVEPNGAGEYIITALATGNTTIKVANLNGLRTESKIEVVLAEDWTEAAPTVAVDEYEYAQGITIANTMVYLTPGETHQVYAELLPAGVADTISYRVSNTLNGIINGQAVELDPSCIEISPDGLIQAVKEGTARFEVSTSTGLRVCGYVTVTADKTGHEIDPDMEVSPGITQYPPRQLTLNRSNIYLIKSEDTKKNSEEIELSFLPGGCDEQYSVKVANTGIAVFDDVYGRFVAVAVGETAFTVETPNGLAVEGTITVVPEAANPGDQEAFPAAIPVSSEVKLSTDSRVIIPKDTLLEVVRIENGEGVSSLELPLGKYYAKELQVPDGIILDSETKYEFEFVYNPAGGTEVVINANGGRPIINYPDKPGKPNKPHNPGPGKEYGKLILEYSEQGMWEKWNPDTGVETEEPPEAITHEFIYESNSPDSEYSVPSGMEQGGEHYKLSEVDYEVLEERRRVEKVIEYQDGEAIPNTITVEEDGEEMTLYLRDTELGELTEQITSVSGEIDFGYTVGKPAAPATKQVSYTDTLTGERRTATAYLTGLVMVEDYHWRDDVVVDAQFFGGSDVDGFRLGVGNTIVPYRSSKPAWENYEEEYLDYLNLSPTQYRITGGEWISGWERNDKGHEVRTAEFTGERLVARWVAYYSTNVNESEQPVTAVYDNGQEDKFIIKAVAVYELGFSPVVFAIITTAVTSVFITALLIAIILYIIKKRRKENENHQYN